MRDSGDPGTGELTLSRRRGRPARHGVAMTDAERAAAYRARRKRTAVTLGPLAAVDAGIAERVSTAALLDTLRNCFAWGDPAGGRRVLRLLGQRLAELDEASLPQD